MRYGTAFIGMACCAILGFWLGTSHPDIFQATPPPPGENSTKAAEPVPSDKKTEPVATDVPAEHTPQPQEQPAVSPALQTPAPAEVAGSAGATSPAAPAPAPASAPGGDAPKPEKPSPLPNVEERLAQLKALTSQDPKNVTAWTELGNIYFDSDMPALAIAAYEQSLALKPNNPRVLTDLGIMYREDGQYSQAVATFDKALRVNPTDQNALFNSGVVLYFDLGRKKEARSRWKRLLQLNPAATAPDGTPVKKLLHTLK